MKNFYLCAELFQLFKILFAQSERRTHTVENNFNFRTVFFRGFQSLKKGVVYVTAPYYIELHENARFSRFNRFYCGIKKFVAALEIFCRVVARFRSAATSSRGKGQSTVVRTLYGKHAARFALYRRQKINERARNGYRGYDHEPYAFDFGRARAREKHSCGYGGEQPYERESGDYGQNGRDIKA